MGTRLLIRFFNKETRWIDLWQKHSLDLWQKHSLDLLPKITVNVIKKTLTELYIGWLFWEIRYNTAMVIGDTCCLKRK